MSEGASLETKVTINGVEYETTSAPLINRFSMPDKMSIGNVLSASCSLSVLTETSVPRSAEVIISCRLTNGDDATASEWLSAGTFYISRRTRDPISGWLNLECYDMMLKTNAEYDFGSVYAAGKIRMLDAVIAIAKAIWNDGNGTSNIDSRTLELLTGETGDAYMIEIPSISTSMRDVLAIIAAVHCGNWIVTPQNKLRLVTLTDVTAGDDPEDPPENMVTVDAILTELNVNPRNTITGIRNTLNNEITLYGNDSGVVLDTAVSSTQATIIYNTLNGLIYQPFEAQTAVYDPALEIGDFITYDDEVVGIVYSYAATLEPMFTGDITAPEPEEIGDEFPYIDAKKKLLNEALGAVEELDNSLNQQEVFNRLTNNGGQQGIYLQDGKIYINATYIQSGQIDANNIQVINLSADNITSGLIRSADYAVNNITPIYPASTLYPSTATYPNNGEEVVSGFAIDFALGQILGGLYSEQIAELQNGLLYPRDAS